MVVNMKFNAVFNKHAAMKKIYMVLGGHVKKSYREFMEFELKNFCAFIKIHENFFRRSLWLS